MADNSSGGAGLGFIVGGLLVAVLVIGAVVFMGGNYGQSKSVDVNIKAPAISAPAASSSSN